MRPLSEAERAALKRTVTSLAREASELRNALAQLASLDHPDDFAGLLGALRLTVEELLDSHNRALEILDAGEI